MGDVVGPDLGRAPGAVGGQVDAERPGGAVSGQNFVETVADLRESCGEGVKTGDGGHAGEVKGVAGGVELAVEVAGSLPPRGREVGASWKSAGEAVGAAVFMVRIGGWRMGLSDRLNGDITSRLGRVSPARGLRSLASVMCISPCQGVELLEFWMVGERSGECAGGGDVGGDSRAGDVQPVEEGCGGKARSADLDGGGVGIADVGDGSGDGEGWWPGGSGGRPAAVDVLKAVEVAGGGAETLEIDVERLGGNKVSAASAGELKAGLDGAVADGSLHVGRKDHVAAEAGVATKKDEAGLAERSVAPLSLEADGNLAGRGGTAERAFKLNGAGVGDVGVGARGVALNAEVPLLGFREPEGKVGVGEGEGDLFLVEFEVETRAGGFDVGKARGGAGFFLGCGGRFNMGGVEEDALEIPLPAAVWTRLTLGSVKLMVENSMRRRQSELIRRVARTESARMTGSEPKAGSSSTTNFSRVKPGSGRRFRLTLLRWTGRPRLALMLLAMRF